jgi:hypothetical protein
LTPLFVPASFERLMGCSLGEFLSWLPRALPDAAVNIDMASTKCTARMPWGCLDLAWSVLPPRRIALLEIPQLSVRFSYSGATEDERYAMQKRFDLATMRGGG